MKLRREGEEIGLAANTVVRPSSADGRLTVQQYTGVVTLTAAGGTAARLITPSYAVTGGGASLVSRLTTPSAMLYVGSGEVDLAAGGRRWLVKAGEAYSSDGDRGGLIVSGSDGASPPAVAPLEPRSATRGVDDAADSTS